MTAKKKPDQADQPKKDRHTKSGKSHFRIPDAFERQLQVLCDRNQSTRTEEIRRAVREYLERQQLWPPPA